MRVGDGTYLSERAFAHTPEEIEMEKVDLAVEVDRLGFSCPLVSVSTQNIPLACNTLRPSLLRSP